MEKISQEKKELEPRCWLCESPLTEEEIELYGDCCQQCYIDGWSDPFDIHPKHPDDPSR